MTVGKDSEFIFLPVYEEMLKRGKSLHEAYRAGNPFPHVVIDDFFSGAVLDRIIESFPNPAEIDWVKFNNKKEIKLATRQPDQIPPYIRQFILNLNSAEFLGFVSVITGIEGLVPDPYLDGGGLHQILNGGKLAIHADFTKGERLKLDRRLNVLVYLNKDWKEEYGGHLELWEKDMSACGKKILPIFNRMVIFSTNSDSYHGHPDALTCPVDRSRKSIALYYYTNGRPKGEVVKDHGTNFKARPGEEFEKLKRRWFNFIG
jgi:hypothetical protein